MSALDGLRCDALVVGGGPAGLAAGIALRLRGLDVAVADARRPPIDKACGEGILPAGVEALERLGVTLGAADGFRFRGIRFLEGGASVEARFSGESGIGVRRTRLHELLAARAASVGVRLFWGVGIPGLVGLPRCRWTIGADGQQSRIRREAGLDGRRLLSSRYGFRRHYWLEPWTDLVEVYWGARSQVYVTPVTTDEIGVALLTRDPRLRLDAALGEHPALQRRLGAGRIASAERGASTPTRRLRRVFSGGTALLGDASGSVDAIAGEGLSLAFQQALALADAVVAGDLRAYQASHERLARGPAATAQLLLLLDRIPRLRPVVWRVLAWQPALFRRALANLVPAVELNGVG